ncbi:sulfurtransferase [Dyadobacter sp. NIV53]|uniref:sulfurtransferase n=1 Tax=Dyadobacter sp. NIV53 TaxID=2861765 RepID=UPI001C872107|nr:sulfurtransferase [Dyadobacter sp. NIV53]
MEIIASGQLAAIIQKGNVVIADARGGADAFERYKSGHLEGALFVDLETQLSNKSENAANGGRHPLPEPSEFGRLLAKLGISPSSTVVIYDDKKGANAAARFWWMLKAARHEKVYVVSGGLDSLVSAGHKITTEISSTTLETPIYKIDSWKLPTVSVEQVAEVSQDNKYLIIDVRENYRYLGESEPIDLVAGHIPGAVNIPYTSNLNEKGEFLSSEELAEKYKNALQGRNPENVFVHCGSGVTACHTLLALSEAGITGPNLYVGSWSEWSRQDRPISTGN